MMISPAAWSVRALLVAVAVQLGGCPATLEQTIIPAGTPPATIGGTWERTDHNSTLVIDADGLVLSETTLNCETPCDGQRHACNLGVGLEMAIDPYHLTVDANGDVTMEAHEVRQYLAGTQTPSLVMTMSGAGRLNGDVLTIETVKDPLGLRQQWTYTKVAD